MGATINATDILQTIANNITGSLSTGSATDAGSTSKGQELNAYSKAFKIIQDNETYINTKSGTDTATGDLIEEIFFSHQPSAATPYTTGTGGSYGGTGYNVVQGNNYANGFNALFIANAIDQLRQADSVSSDASSTDVSRNTVSYRITQAQATGAMTLTLQDRNGQTPSSTTAVTLDFRTKSGTAAESLKLGQASSASAISETTLVLPSGATLGMVNSIEETVYIYAINNSNTIELAVINNQKLDESILHSTTAIDGTADSAGTLYSTSARTDVPVRLIGRMRITRDDNTTFDEDPTELTVFGFTSGEFGKDEKLYFNDTNQYVSANNTSIKIVSDTRVDLDSSVSHVTGNLSLSSSAGHLSIGTTSFSSGYHLDISNTAPILRLTSTDTATTADAKRSRIEMESDDGITMFQLDVKHDGSSDDDKAKVIFSNRGTSTLSSFMSVDSLQDVTFSSNVTVSGSFTESSDRSLKTNVRDLDDPLSKVMALRGVKFDWKDGDNNQIGLIADEVEEVLPTLVKRDSNNLASLQYSKMVALLIEGMKEQQKKIDDLEEKLSKVGLV